MSARHLHRPTPEMPAMPANCEHCRWWNDVGVVFSAYVGRRRLEVGECMREAPMHIDGGGIARFPLTLRDTRCGRFTRKRPGEPGPVGQS